MMKLGKPIMIILAVIATGMACGTSRSATVPIPEKTAGFNLLVVADGDIQLKRDGWSDFHPTGFGVALHRGDQLRLAPSAKAVVLCDNLAAWTVPSGAPSGLSNGCPQASEPALVRLTGNIENTIGNTRGSTDPLIPYIISPRATKLLGPTPTLRWNSAPGAKSYTVRISGTDWQESVNATEFVYPGNPPLQFGQDYLLVVETDNGKSSKDEGMPGLGFSLLADGEAKRIRADETTIHGLNLPKKADTFALAQIYADHSLYAEAIEMLEDLAKEDSQAASVYRALGELYQQVGLLTLAESRHNFALKAAETSGDVESIAAAQKGLGEVYMALGNKNEAVRWLTEAKAGYESLGDLQRANQIADQLQDLGKQ